LGHSTEIAEICWRSWLVVKRMKSFIDDESYLGVPLLGCCTTPENTLLYVWR